MLYVIKLPDTISLQDNVYTIPCHIIMSAYTHPKHQAIALFSYRSKKGSKNYDTNKYKKEIQQYM